MYRSQRKKNQIFKPRGSKDLGLENQSLWQVFSSIGNIFAQKS